MPRSRQKSCHALWQDDSCEDREEVVDAEEDAVPRNLRPTQQRKAHEELPGNVTTQPHRQRVTHRKS